MNLCSSCLPFGYCRKQESLVVTESELTSAFVQDARNFAYNLTQEFGLTAGEWIDYLVNAYRDHPGLIVDRAGDEIYLDTELLERPYPVDKHGWFDCADHTEYDSRTWFRDHLTRPCGPRPRKDNTARLIVVFSILRSRFPQQAMLWGIRSKYPN